MKTILIIEDDIILLENIADYLDSEGFRTLSVTNGKDAISMAIKNIPDLIICDIKIPGIKGYEVFKLLQENSDTSQIPFIFLTAKVEKEDIRAGMQMGVDDYITKPFDFDELLTTINTRIRKREKIYRESNEKYRILFESSLIGVFIYQNHSIVYANPKLLQITGYSKNELKTINLLSKIAQDDKKQLVQKLRNCWLGILETFNTKISIISRQGEVIKLKINGGLTKHDGKKAIIGNVLTIENKKNSDNNHCTALKKSKAIEKAIQILEKHQDDIPADSHQRIQKIYQSIKEKNIPNQSIRDSISEREKQVLKYICEGLPTIEIAEKLYLSKRTIDRHRSNLLSKTNTKNMAELAIFASKNNLIQS